MPTLDTNVLVRYLVGDDAEQFRRAKELIESTSLDDSFYVPVSVSIELEWVLRSLYGLDKAVVSTIFNSLLESREIEFQCEDVVEITMSLYADHDVDFADCLHIASAYSSSRLPLITFDRARLLE